MKYSANGTSRTSRDHQQYSSRSLQVRAWSMAVERDSHRLKRFVENVRFTMRQQRERMSEDKLKRKG